MNLNQLVVQSYTTASKHGFWKKKREVGTMLMLIVSELSEALEAHREGNVNKNHDEIKDHCFEMEIADTFIRLADMCGGLGIPIEKYIEWKMAYNEKRPVLHGKKY